MAQTRLAAVLRHIRQLTPSPDLSPSDRDYLERFTAQRDEAAFAALVQRHGGMVLGVARRVLHHQQDAEDVFQATFLILARKATSIRRHESVGAWLHQVAQRVALKARSNIAKRKQREQREPVSTSNLDDVTWRELRAALDEELAKLPAPQRQALVLCYLEGQRHEEAARQLGWTVATLRRRLSQGRELLRRRLVRRGLTLSAALLTTLAAETAAPAAVPATLLALTLRAALAIVSGQTVSGIVSPNAAMLADSGIKTLFAAKVKATLALLLVLGGAVAGSAVLVRETPVAEQAKREPQAGKEAKPQAEEVIEVRGRVLDPDGKPVARAKLYLPRSLGLLGERPNERAVIERGVTDTDGRFKFKLPRKEAQPGGRPVPLVAVADGFGIDWIELPQEGAPDELTFRLVKDVPIRGRLVSTEGKPLAGVAVHLLGVMVPNNWEAFLKVYQLDRLPHFDDVMAKMLDLPLSKVLHVTPTDKDGRFEIKGAGVDRLIGLEVKHAALSESTILVVTRQNLDLGPINKAILQKPGSRRENPPLYAPSFEYVLEPARVIEGSVREAGSGKLLAGVTVQAAGVTTTTDAEGRYRLAGMRKSEQYTLQVTAPKDVPLVGRWVRVPSPQGLEPAKADVEMTRGVLVTGRVYDKATGKGVESGVRFSPLPENTHKLASSPELALSAFTDADGRFRLVTIPGPGVLLAQVAGSFHKIDEVSLNPYKVAEFDAEDRKRVKVSTDKQNGFRDFAVAGGTLETLDLNNACKVLDVKEGEPAKCDLALDPGKTMTVTVQDADGKLLAGAMAGGICAGPFGKALLLKTARCPVVALDPEQPRRLVLLHPERKLAGIVTVRGDETEPIVVRLGPTGVITGQLLDMEGQPIAGAYVIVRYQDRVASGLVGESFFRGAMPQTDPEGRFRLDSIVPGIKFDVDFVKGRQRLAARSRPEWKYSLDAGKTLDLGNMRVKPVQ